MRTRLPLLVLFALGCGEGAADSADSADAGAQALDAAPDARPTPADGGGPADAGPARPRPVRVMTFNGGTTDGLPHGRAPDDGYDGALAAIADEHYENSLSWNPAEAALTAWIAAQRIDVAVFQEIFHDPWCADIPVDPDLDFVCRGWTPERPWQIQRLFGPGYQVACAPGQPDNCLAVRTAFATLRGCPLDAPCPEGLEGAGPPSGCSRGARVGRAVLDLAAGGTWTVVNVHGTSGFGVDDAACRVDQFRQIFADRGDGQPAANGPVNLVMGDFNTDPVFFADNDPSAAELTALVDAYGFEFLSPTARDAPATYEGIPVRIDHVIADALTGECVIAGGTAGEPPVMDAVYWDHRPVVCDVRAR